MNEAMRNTFRPWRMVAALSLALSAPAWAGGGHAGDKFKDMDADRDGMVSATEYAASVSRMFGEMDANHDGNVTAAEMDARHHGKKIAAVESKEPVTYNDAATDEGPMRPELSSADRIARLDASGDGMLSAAEHEAGAESMFKELDNDGNGNLSQQEVAASHASMHKDKTSKPTYKTP
ncbi:CREC-EF hand family protein [Agrilutibacter solisilvae]|uniref:EF-hand domain-containing protein n=1 Tax=Agrilutibacter solisilvae TaxID=2763317 RepID=A0A975ATE5_9GAMM|nr:hypothetical protein [Lysobacter solisilvae]QSX78925.1 hypothetical protein I8J32_003085 [Lysobacter solisilvae]